MGTLSVTHLRGGKGIFDDLKRFVCRFQALKGPPKAPRESPTFLNGQGSVPWEVEIKYSTMGWFHYGNTELFLTWEVDKGIFDDLKHFFCSFQAMKSPLRAPLGPQWFSTFFLAKNHRMRDQQTCRSINRQSRLFCCWFVILRNNCFDSQTIMKQPTNVIDGVKIYKK